MHIGNNIGKMEEKALLILIIGSLEAVKNGGITIDEAEKFLFSPYIIRVLRHKMCSEKIVYLIEKGCELEDIYSLVPDKLNLVIDELKQEAMSIVKNYEKYDKENWLIE